MRYSSVYASQYADGLGRDSIEFLNNNNISSLSDAYAAIQRWEQQQRMSPLIGTHQRQIDRCSSIVDVWEGLLRDGGRFELRYHTNRLAMIEEQINHIAEQHAALERMYRDEVRIIDRLRETMAVAS